MVELIALDKPGRQIGKAGSAARGPVRLIVRLVSMNEHERRHWTVTSRGKQEMSSIVSEALRIVEMRVERSW